jgi:uncharacterized membrane protein YeaQ/YmgE (transglycosylase-associated protein family)
VGLLSWLAVGLATGWFSGIYVKSSGYGRFGDVALGVIGAVTGGFLAALIFASDHPISGVSLPSLIVAGIAAAIFVGAVGTYPGRAPI